MKNTIMIYLLENVNGEWFKGIEIEQHNSINIYTVDLTNDPKKAQFYNSKEEAEQVITENRCLNLFDAQGFKVTEHEFVEDNTKEMKAIPTIEDFKLDFKKFPKRQLGGIVDMNAVKRMDDRDAMFELAKEQWMQEAEQQIKELKELLKVSICPNKRCVDGTIEVGNYIEQGLEQCQFCDERKQALK